MDHMQPPRFGYETPDEFGIPSNMFGVIETDFAAALSRVVMLGALLEDRLWTLLTQLETPATENMIFEGPTKNVVYQSDHAGRNAKQLIDDTRLALKALAPQFQHHVGDGQQLMTDVEDVFRERNNFVHNVWSRPTLNNGWGH